MTAVKSANLALRFLLELGALVAFGYWGFHTGGSTPAKVALGIGAPLLVAVVWGVFVAPRAVVTLPPLAKFLLGLIVLLLAAAALVAAGHPAWGLAFGVVAAVNAVLDFIWKPEVAPDRSALDDSRAR